MYTPFPPRPPPPPLPSPFQAAFCTSRLSKGGTGGPLSPPGSNAGGGSGGGPALGPAPVCLTPRKSMMRCPPTPQRTPTWDGLEDSLLLEGAGSGGRGSGGGGGLSMSLGSGSRSCLRQSKLLACSSDDRAGGDGGGQSLGLGPTGMSINAGLANAASASGGAAPRRSSPRFEAMATDDTGASSGGGGGSGSGGRDSGSFGGARSTGGGRRGRGRGARGRSSGGGGSSSSSGRGGAAEHKVSAGGDGDGDGGAGAGAVAGAGASAGAGAGAADSTLGFKHDFVQMGPIGEGGFSVVWKVRAKGTGRMYAIKRSKREFRGRRDRDRCLLEARALQRLGEHPGVLRFERAWQEEGHFCLQTELCELGTVKDFLERVSEVKEGLVLGAVVVGSMQEWFVGLGELVPMCVHTTERGFIFYNK